MLKPKVTKEKEELCHNSFLLRIRATLFRDCTPFFFLPKLMNEAFVQRTTYIAKRFTCCQNPMSNWMKDLVDVTIRRFTEGSINATCNKLTDTQV